MKTNRTMKHILLALTMTLSMAACKKDKKTDPTPTPVEVKAMTFTELKALSTGASVKVPDAKKITGIVISDIANKNIDSKTVVLQEATDKPGIIITFDAAQTFALGDQVEVVISNQTLAQVNGEIEVTNVPAANAKKTGTATINAKATTVADIVTNKVAWDGTLVSLVPTGMDGGNGKYTGTITIADANGTIKSNILAGASFENTAYPLSATAVTGIVRISGNDVRLDIRKAADVVTGTITRVLVEDFTNMAIINVDPNVPSYASYFNDAFGSWAPETGSVGWIFPGTRYDGDFTTQGRSYIYWGIGIDAKTSPEQLNDIFQTAENSKYLTANVSLAGLKQVSITFAGSKMSGAGVLPSIGASPALDVPTFNEATDYFQIAIDVPGYAIPALVVKSPKYTKAGQFYTFTFTIPTKEQLVAGGMDEGSADAFLANPGSSIFYNLSARAGNTPGGVAAAPILIDKIVYGF